LWFECEEAKKNLAEGETIGAEKPPNDGS